MNSNLPIIKPVFQNKFAIGMTCSNQYVPYLAVYLRSIFDHTQNAHDYDIVILESDISPINKQIIKNLDSRPNISIRFCNLSAAFNTQLYTYGHFAPQCYYRLAAGEIFQEYQKVLFTDIDLVCTHDMYDFFNIDLGDHPIAACEEVLWLPQMRSGLKQEGEIIDRYLQKILKDPTHYYNTGVILLNVGRFNAVAGFAQFLEEAKSSQYINLEQCVLNKIFNGQFYALNPIYNFEIIDKVFTDSAFSDYAALAPKAKIYHYLAANKVWQFPTTPYGFIWWQYARRTPFYEEIIQRMNHSFIRHYLSNLFRYKKYHYLQYLGFGKTKRRWQIKAAYFQQLLND